MFLFKGSPFTETAIQANNKQVRSSALIDTGWDSCEDIDPLLAAELGYPTSEFMNSCVKQGYPDVTIGPWVKYQVGSGNFAGKKVPDGHLPQRATISSGVLFEQLFELDFGEPEGVTATFTVFQGEQFPCAQPAVPLKNCEARWQGHTMQRIPLRYFSACSETRKKENQGSGEPRERPAVPTFETNVEGKELLMQVDTGRDDGSGVVDISVNRLAFDAVSSSLALTEVPYTRTTGACTISHYKASKPLHMKIGDRDVELEQLELREGDCNPPYTWREPAGLAGMSVWKSTRRMIIDPNSETMLLEWRPKKPIH